jgi:hypothetical protein
MNIHEPRYSAQYTNNGQTLHIAEAWLLLFSPAFRKSAKIGKQIGRGGHRHLQIGRMLDIDFISEPPHAPSPQM